MSRPSGGPGPEQQRRSTRRLAVAGAAGVLVAVAVLAWARLPVQLEIVAVLMPFVLVAGTIVLAVAITRAWRRRSDRILPLALAAVAALVLAGVLVSAWPADATELRYLQRGLQVTYLLLAGALSQLGLFTLLGCLAAAVARRRSRRDAA